MLVEEIVVVVVGCQMFSAKFVTNLVVKLPFATIAMKNTMFLHSLWFTKTHKPLLQLNNLPHNKYNLTTSITTNFFCSVVYAYHGSFSLLYYPSVPCVQNVGIQATFTHSAHPQANIATASSTPSNRWYPDFGASHHATNVSQNIQQLTPFEGPY